jgi:hypothetical protein
MARDNAHYGGGTTSEQGTAPVGHILLFLQQGEAEPTIGHARMPGGARKAMDRDNARTQGTS